MTANAATAQQEQRVPRMYLSTRPWCAVLAGILLAELLSVLPAQVNWAEGYPGGLWAELRTITVSPTLLSPVHQGSTSALLELLWLAAFCVLTLTLAHLAAERLGTTPRSRSSALRVALPLVAPAANAMAYVVASLPDLFAGPRQRGDYLATVLYPPERGAAHALLLGCVAACAVRAADAIALKRARRRREEWAQPSPPVSKSSTVLACTGGSLWRLVGILVTTGVVFPLLILTLSSKPVGAFLTGITRQVCRGGDSVRSCTDMIPVLFGRSLPHNNIDVLRPQTLAVFTLWAMVAAAFLFAFAYLRLPASLVAPRPGPVLTLIRTWYAYTWAAVLYGTSVSFAADRISSGPLPWHELLRPLVPPPGLSHALYAAPLAGLLFAGAHALWMRRRSGKA